MFDSASADSDSTAPTRFRFNSIDRSNRFRETTSLRTATALKRLNCKWVTGEVGKISVKKKTTRFDLTCANYTLLSAQVEAP